MSTRRRIFLIVAAALLTAVAILVAVFFSLSGGEPSAPISAPTLSLAEAAGAAPTPPPPAKPTATPAPSTESAFSAPSPTPTTTPTPGPVIASSPRLYRISSEHSEARYVIDEILSGNEETIVGSTDQIAGDVIIDARHPGNSVLGEIVVNAKTFLTGTEPRDRAVRVFVFRSFKPENEFIQFKPTGLLDLPESLRYGELVVLRVAGYLTIRQVTGPAVFTIELRVLPAGEIRVLAWTVIDRADFEISIPSNPNVAWVDEMVRLEATIVAFEVTE